MTLNENEFRALVQEHQTMVFSIALRILGERGVAEEVAQDVFLELYGALDKVESAEHVKFWLRRVTVFRATDGLRRRAKQPEFRAEEWLEELSVRLGKEQSEEPIVTRLEQMLLTLPDALRGAVVLRYQEEMLPDEIARALSQPVATVKSNLQRGLSLLRKKAEVTLKEFRRERVG